MIKINSDIRFSFMFPAELPIAYEYYSDMHRLVSYLKYIKLVNSESDRAYRMYYNTTELGAYHIHLYCDVRLDLITDEHIIRLIPIDVAPPIEAKVSLNATTTRGSYSSEARFYDEGEQTRIEYMLKIQAESPRPKGMRFMPGRMVDKIAQNITNHRVKEIANYFIDSSIDAYPLWHTERTESQL